MQINNPKNTRLYKVEHTLDIKERSQHKQSKINYDMAISYIANEKRLQRMFTKENLKISSKPSHDPNTDMVCNLELAMYPLTVEVNKYENYIQIVYYNLWKEKWLKKSGALLNTKYQEGVARQLRDQYKQAIETEEKLKQKIQEEAFWRLYFFGVSENQNEKSLRWSLHKIGTVYFLGAVHNEIKGNEIFSGYDGCPKQLEDKFIENINYLLDIKKYTRDYITKENIKSQCKVTAHWEKDSGKLLSKTASINIYTVDKEITYSEKIDIKFHSIRMEKNPARSQRSFLNL